MTQELQPQRRELCPHLAAAALWMSKRVQPTRLGKIRIRDLRTLGSGPDDLIAL